VKLLYKLQEREKVSHIYTPISNSERWSVGTTQVIYDIYIQDICIIGRNACIGEDYRELFNYRLGHLTSFE